MSARYWFFILLVKVKNFLRSKHLVLKESLHGGGTPTAYFTLISTFMVIVIQPLVEIFL